VSDWYCSVLSVDRMIFKSSAIKAKVTMRY
jgi:hypothetical protein